MLLSEKVWVPREIVVFIFGRRAAVPGQFRQRTVRSASRRGGRARSVGWPAAGTGYSSSSLRESNQIWIQSEATHPREEIRGFSREEHSSRQTCAAGHRNRRREVLVWHWLLGCYNQRCGFIAMVIRLLVGAAPEWDSNLDDGERQEVCRIRERDERGIAVLLAA